MIVLSAQKREKTNKKQRDKNFIPAVLYGPKIKNESIQVDKEEFSRVFEQAGESTLVSLDLEGKKFLVLIYEVQKDPLNNEVIHIDFYQPDLKKKVETNVPLVFEGEAPAVKDLGGTLVKEIQELEIKAFPQNLPHEIKVNVDVLKTFEDEILIKDIKAPEGVEILNEPEAVVALVLPPEKVEEELKEPIEEKVEEVEKAEEEKEEDKEKEEKKEEKQESASE